MTKQTLQGIVTPIAVLIESGGIRLVAATDIARLMLDGMIAQAPA